VVSERRGRRIRFLSKLVNRQASTWLYGQPTRVRHQWGTVGRGFADVRFGEARVCELLPQCIRVARAAVVAACYCFLNTLVTLKCSGSSPPIANPVSAVVIVMTPATIVPVAEASVTGSVNVIDVPVWTYVPEL